METFNQTTQKSNGSAIVPPISSTIEGQLVLGLYENGHGEMAINVYVALIAAPLRLDTTVNGIGARVEAGKILLNNAYVAEALPFQKTSSQKLAGAARSAQSHAESIKGEAAKAKAKIQELDDSNHAFVDSLDAHRENQSNDFIALMDKLDADAIQNQETFLDQLLNNDARYAEQQGTFATQAEMKSKHADERNKSIQHAAFKRLKEQKSEFERLLDLFHTQLQFKEPAKLWAERAKNHKKSANWALVRFGLFGFLAIVLAVLIPMQFGNYIASSFFEECQEGNAIGQSCERVFSAKGPLTISGLFLIFSVLLWTIRLQYKIYLSERHLGLDASEKEAFAATFLALKEGKDVGAESEAIVLSSLFRPTQDGIIKDDDAGLDISAMSLLAKQLGR